jgi:hypothetical protein
MEYELTGEGDLAYLALLRTALSSRDPRLDLLAAAVGLIDDLSRAEAIELLRRRARTMDQWRASITGQLPAGTDLQTWGPVGEVLGLWIHTADSRAEWTHRLIRRLEEGAFRMAGEA